MSAEPADTKHTVLFKHINAVSAICHANVPETTGTRSEDEEVGDVWFLAGGG